MGELENKVQPLPSAIGVVFHCADAYTEYLPRESLLREETLLAYYMNGKPLTDEHGFPLRVIVPFKYGYKNPKAILKMEYVSNFQAGTWSKIGAYSMDGTILPGYRPSPGIWQKTAPYSRRGDFRLLTTPDHLFERFFYNKVAFVRVGIHGF